MRIEGKNYKTIWFDKNTKNLVKFDDAIFITFSNKNKNAQKNYWKSKLFKRNGSVF